MPCIPSRFSWRASASDGDNSSDKVSVEVKKSLRNPVDTAQVNSCGSIFYASGYDEVNKEGYVLMQTLSGVAPDGREVVAVVAPGKYAPGKSVLVEARHVVDKPKDLDWERAAMLPFLVSPTNKDKILCSLKSYSLLRTRYIQQYACSAWTSCQLLYYTINTVQCSTAVQHCTVVVLYMFPGVL